MLLTREKYPIPAISFSQKVVVPRIKSEYPISVSQNKTIEAKFRNIFKDTTITFTSAKQARRWLNSPDMNYWPQQLNFAVFCSTSACGISLAESENYPPIIKIFIKLHVYFTIRRI